MASISEHFIPIVPTKGQGAVSNPPGRFCSTQNLPYLDTQWKEIHTQDDNGSPSKIQLKWDNNRTIINQIQSKHHPNSQSINPYRGCEHGCSYCYARETHAYLDLSPGIDFERKIFAKSNATTRLKQALSKPNYRVRPIAFGINTDCYQPVEKSLRITRDLLQILHDYNHPVHLFTKSSLIRRDLDLLVPMAEKNLLTVNLSLTTLDNDLRLKMEPRAASPKQRLKTIQTLSQQGIKINLMIAPLILSLTDHELEDLLSAGAEMGCHTASYSLLRLPHEVEQIFTDWLSIHFPGKKNKILNQQFQSQQTKDHGNISIESQLIKKRFQIKSRKLNIDRPIPPLDHTQFTPMTNLGKQAKLWSP